MTRWETLVFGVFIIATLWALFVILAAVRRIERKVERVNAIEGLLINWKRECDRRCGQ